MIYCIQIITSLGVTTSFCFDSINILFRGTVKEYLMKGVVAIVDEAKKTNEIFTITNLQDDDDASPNKSLVCKVIYYKGDNKTMVMVASKDFESETIRDIIKRMMTIFFTQPSLDKFIKEHQDPKKFDQMIKIQRELDSVKGVMLNNIDKALQREM